jgi:hypothetical protein
MAQGGRTISGHEKGVSTEPVREAIGALGECVMSVYSIHRMLQSRDLGPTQLLPPVREFAVESQKCADVGPAFAALIEASAAQSAGLEDVLAELCDRSLRLADELGGVLAAAGKLGARERLALERELLPLGHELQGLRDLLQVVNGALHPRPARLTVSELLHVRWRGRPAFVAQRVELHLAAASGQFEADPRVMWGLVERSLGELVEAGLKSPFASLSSADGRPMLQLGEHAGISTETIERVTVDLTPNHPSGAAVLAAVARFVGADADASNLPLRRCIGVAA